MTAKELLELDIEEPDWQVDKIISENGITMIAGAYKSSKTLFALYIAVCVAIGTPVFGKYNVKKGRVFYIDEENGEREMKSRLKRIMDGLSVDECDIDFMIYKNLKLEHRDEKVLRGKHQLFIKKYIEERKPVLVICDSMVRFMKGNENSSEDVREIFDFIKPFKEKTSWLLLHHTPKSDKFDARGSSDWFAQVDDALILSRLGGSHNFKLNSKASRRNVWITGEKYQIVGEEKEPLIFEYRGQEERTEEGHLFEKLAGKIKEWMKNNELPQFTRQQVNTQFKTYSLSTITESLNSLVDEMILERTGNTRNTIYKVI